MLQIRLFLPDQCSYGEVRTNSPKLFALLDEIDVQCSVRGWDNYPETLPVLKAGEVAFVHMPDPKVASWKHVAHFAAEKGYFLFYNDQFINSVGTAFERAILLSEVEERFSRRRVLINIASPEEQDPTIFSISMRDWRELKVAARITGRNVKDFISDLIHKYAWTNSPIYTSKGRIEAELILRCGRCGETKTLGFLKEDQRPDATAFIAGYAPSSQFGWVCPNCARIVVASKRKA